jgi:hypothetical protein
MLSRTRGATTGICQAVPSVSWVTNCGCARLIPDSEQTSFGKEGEPCQLRHLRDVLHRKSEANNGRNTKPLALSVDVLESVDRCSKDLRGLHEKGVDWERVSTSGHAQHIIDVGILFGRSEVLLLSSLV